MSTINRRGRLAFLALPLLFCVSAAAGDHHRRARRNESLPANAIQPPGASYEHQPNIGRRQKIAIVEEGLRASVAGIFHHPVDAAEEMLTRTLERVSVRLHEAARPFAFAHEIPDRPPLCPPFPGTDLAGGIGGPITPLKITFLPSSGAALQGLFDIIAQARSRIDLMIYGWQDDPTGREVARRLADRARQGVVVRLLVDRTGFLIHNPADARDEPTFLDALRRVPNVFIVEPPCPFFRLDHRKLAIVDDRIAWTGSMILTEVARRRWRNFSFLVEGEMTRQYAALFEQRWREQGGGRFAPVAVDPSAAGPPNAVARMVRTDLGERTLKNALYAAVDHATNHIYLENPYFSDHILTEKLVRARARGVRVEAVLTLRGNIHTFNEFETITANRLLRAGARVYLYPTMTHVKAMSIDGVWGYVGTGNFDELSLRNNREVSLCLLTPAIVREMNDLLFLPDIAASQRIVRPLPMPKDALKRKALELWY